MDPQQRQQRMLLECVWGCFESGAIKVEELKGERLGCMWGLGLAIMRI